MDIRQYLSSPVVNGGGGVQYRIAIWDSANDIVGVAPLTYDYSTDSFTAGNNASSNSTHTFNGRSLNLTYGVSGGTANFTVYNTSNTAGSAALANIAVQGGSAGDPAIQWTVLGVTDWISGIDNSDSDKWKLSFGTVLGTNDYLTVDASGKLTVNASGSTQLHDVYGRGWNIAYANAGIAMYCQMAHSSNSAGSSAYFYAQVAGSSAGDAAIQFAVQSVTTWTVGLDNSASDSFVIANAAALGGASDYMTITTAGAVGFVGTVTSNTSGGPQFIAKDGGTFGTNADPHIQFEDSVGSGGRIGFTDGASKDLKIQNQTDTGILDFVTSASQIAGSAGAATGTYWTFKLGGTTYKVALLANA